MRFLRSALVLGALVASASAAAAQPGRAPMPMPGRGASPAVALLSARAALGLTEEQIARLERLATAQAAAPAGAPGDALRARADLVDALRGEGDPVALKRAMDRMHQIRTDRAVARLRARQEARAILTAEQRAKADAMRQAMRGARREAMRNGRRGMMRDGMRRNGGGQRRGAPQGMPPRPPLDEPQP